jgi:hypothetical protein
VEALEERALLSVFNAPFITNLPTTPDAVATGHFRGASAPLDTVTANVDGTVSVLQGNGDGTFQSPVNLPVFTTASSTRSVAVGDLLGNGVQDIVVANFNTVQVLLGNGDGTFQAPQTALTNSVGLGDLTLGDFLGNGRQDILTVENGKLTVLLSNGDGTFQAPIDTPLSGVPFNNPNVPQIAVGDFAHDGHLGLAVVDTQVVGTSSHDFISVLRGNGDGTFSPESTVDVGVSGLRAADLTGSGNLDLIGVTRDFEFSPDHLIVLRGNGDGTFQAPVSLSYGNFPSNSLLSFAVGDFTGHGRADILTLNQGQVDGFAIAPNYDVWVNNGDGTFHNRGATPFGGINYFLAAGDFHGTGKLDFLTTSNDGVTVFQGNGDGSFVLAPSFAAGFVPVAVAAGDFTGSGRAQDVVVAAPGGGLSVLLGNGDGSFRSPVSLFGAASEDSFAGLAVGDFLGNGKEDIAVAITDVYTETSSVLIFLGNGNGTFQQTPLTLTTGFFGSGPHVLVASDLNGDGRTDLIVSASPGVSVFLSNGDGTFQAPENFTIGSVSDLAVADLRGNGTLDLIVATSPVGGQGAVDVLLGNGDGTFQNPVTAFTGAGGKLAVGDFLGNGLQDVITYTRNGTLNLLPGNGDGTFGSPITTTTGLGLDTVAVGDFVGNGHLGLAFTATTDRGATVLPASGDGGVIVLQGNGDGTFQFAGEFLAGLDQNRSSTFLSNRGLVAGDFNGDGLLDLITTDYGAGGDSHGTITVLLNQGGQMTAAPPTVDSIVVNDGSVQRSEVTSLTVTFSTQVALTPGALEVQRQDGSDVGINVATTVVGGHTVAVVTFTGPDIVDGSLPDGTYTLTVHHSLVHDGSGQTLAQDATLSFFRLLGDVDGDGVIDDNDLAAAPTVTNVILNEGDPTNAQVHSITVHFSEGVTLADGAFSLVRQDGSAITLNVSTAVVAGDTVATITFSAPDLINGALPDGAYTFTIHGDQVHDGLGLALGHDFSGDRSVDFFGADGADQPDLVALFHPASGG